MMALPSAIYPLLQAGAHAKSYPGLWPVLRLLVQIECEVGSRDSYLRALNRLQTFCGGMQVHLSSLSPSVICLMALIVDIFCVPGQGGACCHIWPALVL
jgi:hypothetical protein